MNDTCVLFGCVEGTNHLLGCIISQQQSAILDVTAALRIIIDESCNPALVNASKAIERAEMRLADVRLLQPSQNGYGYESMESS